MKSKAPRILFVVPSFGTGGAERVMVTLFNNLPIENKYIVATSTGGVFQDFIKDPSKASVLGTGRVRNSLWPLLRLIWQKKPDVVISTITHLNFLVLLLKPFMPWGTRVIVRDATLPSYFLGLGKRKSLMVRAAYWLLYPFASAVVAPSARVIDELKTIYKVRSRRFILLPNPVDISLIREQAAEANAVVQDSKSLKMVCVGRLNHAKGLDRLIPELASLPESFAWHLDLYGEGEERKGLEALVGKYQLGDKITFHGSVQNPWAPMAKADVLLLPSRREGLPNVVLEALAVGLPVIASKDAGGIQEIADHANGAVKVAQSMEQFRAMIMEAKPLDASDSLRASLLPPHYTVENIMGAFAVLLNQVLGRKN